MIWWVRGVLGRAANPPGFILSLPDELMHQHDETLGDEFEREFMKAMSEPVDPE